MLSSLAADLLTEIFALGYQMCQVNCIFTFLNLLTVLRNGQQFKVRDLS